MAKGGNNQRSNGSRFTKSHDTSNSFVTKVATRVSDYLGGWFGTPLKSSDDAVDETDVIPQNASGDTTAVTTTTSTTTNNFIFENVEPGRSTLLTPRVFDNAKTNGVTDNHSDSSESTSGCSSLVPQSDRLSQSAYVCSTRKRNLEEKLKYARQLQQTRASMYLNRSIPVRDAPSACKKPSFDVTAYGSPALDKSLLRDKLINSPFYTGKTSYGGASAYRLSRNTFYSQRSPRDSVERREGMSVQVKPCHHGSTEDLSNMSHTAKKILEALEQFSTPVSDAKRIPVSRSNVPLGTKRRRFDGELPEKRLRLSTPISPLNPNPGPVITGLNVPTVPDLLKLKRLERIQNSTAAARQVAVQKEEYTLPKEADDEPPPKKRTGKIVTKLRNKEKDIELEKLEEVNLPTIPLPITTLPKFDFQLPLPMQPTEKKTETVQTVKIKSSFVFSPPIPVTMSALKASEKKPVAQELPRTPEPPPKETAKPSEPAPKPTQNGFGDLFKKPANQWECSVCMIRNKETDTKCAACETPKPGAKPEATESKFGSTTMSLGGGFKFGIDKAGTEESGVKSAADSSTFQFLGKGSDAPATKPPQFNAISTSVGVFTFGIPPAQNKKEEPKLTPKEPAKPETNGNFLVTSTSGSNLQKEEPPKEKSEPEKVAETKQAKDTEPKVDTAKTEMAKPFVFGALNKSPVKPLFGSVAEEKPKATEEPKKPNFFFGSSSNSTTLETVSSSTTDFTIQQNKQGLLGVPDAGSNKPGTGLLSVPDVGGSKPPTLEFKVPDEKPGQLGISDAGPSKPLASFQFKPFTPSETGASKPSLNPLGGEKKSETTGFTSGTLSTVPQPFAPTSMFETSSKPTSGAPATVGLGFGSMSNSSSTIFGASSPVFASSGFTSQPQTTTTTAAAAAPPAKVSFGVTSQAAEKPTMSMGIGFGSAPAPFAAATPNPFGSAGSSAPNPEAPKAFGSFGGSSTMPRFGMTPTPTPTPAFGSGFMQSSSSSTGAAAKPPAPAPFIFGAPNPTPATTSTPAQPAPAPGVFTFGAPKPESKPAFSFGQNTAPTFSFGSSNVPASNAFMGMGQAKPAESAPLPASGFGTPVPTFGQSSAPAAFESAAPKFEFGASTAQQQQPREAFQFGMAPAQPASAGTGFSLSVPQKFNFTGGQSPTVFSASPGGTEPSSAGRERPRKVIKAVRRTTLPRRP